MEPTNIELSEVTVSRSHYGKPLIRISQDKDLVIIEDDDVEAFVAAVYEHCDIIKKPETTPHITAEVEDLRMARGIARAHIQRCLRDVAYEEGKISAIDSMLED